MMKIRLDGGELSHVVVVVVVVVVRGGLYHVLSLACLSTTHVRRTGLHMNLDSLAAQLL
jgi:hypothetical protein